MSVPTELRPSVPPPGPHTRRARRRVVLAASTLLVLAGLAYAPSDSGPYRPLAVPGNPTPLARLLDASSRRAVGPGGGGDPVGRTPAAVHIDPHEYAGIDVTLDDPSGHALDPFYEALLRTAQGRAGALTRIGQYGDSSIATDLITYTMRRHLQQRFGDGGHGFVLIARGTMPYRHRDVRQRANDRWTLREIVREQDRSGRYGYGGVEFRPLPGAWAAFGTDAAGPVGGSVAHYEIFYEQHPHGGNVRIRIDHEAPRLLSTRGDAIADGFDRIDVPDGPHDMEIRPGGGGPVRLYGVVMERDGPGVVYDSMGLVGARASRLLGFDADHIAAQIAHRHLDLLILGFGGNDADDAASRTAKYEPMFRSVIERMRGGRRDMACLVFAPVDQGHRDVHGRIVTMPAVPNIVASQRRAAAAEGCAFYDTWHAMGGDGSMARWYRARPQLAFGDFRHATPAGYDVIGNRFYKALLEGFAQWLDARGSRGTVPAPAEPHGRAGEVHAAHAPGPARARP